MYNFMRVFTWLLGRFSPRALERAAKFLSWLLFDLLRLRRGLVLRNLETAFGDSKSKDELLSIARLSVFNFIQTLFETLSSARYSLTTNIEVRGGEHLRAALAQGHGAYVLCFHMGNWEAMASKITQDFVRSYALMKPIGSKGMNRFVEELREKNGLFWIKRGKRGDGYRGIREVLARGEIVGFIIDQARPGEPRLPFFSKPAKTNTSLAAIWCRARAPIVPVFIHRQSFGHHIIECQPELVLQETASSADDIIHNSLIFNRVVETAVRRYPEHYFWFHNRWK